MNEYRLFFNIYSLQLQNNVLCVLQVDVFIFSHFSLGSLHFSFRNLPIGENKPQKSVEFILLLCHEVMGFIPGQSATVFVQCETLKTWLFGSLSLFNVNI